MKTIFISLFLALFLSVSTFAQSPEKMSYQAVIRDSSGKLVANQEVGMKISILYGKFKTPVYVETSFPESNSNGLVSLEIGDGNVVSGDFEKINWAKGTYYIKTETDIKGGKSFDITSISQLLSVPYAMYAKSAGNIAGSVKHIPVSIYSVHVSDGASLSAGMADGSGVLLSKTGISQIAFNFTIPDDYTPGDTIFIHTICSSNGTGDIILLPNFTSIAQPGVGFNTSHYSDSGLVFGKISLTERFAPVKATGYLVSPDESKTLHPGDAVTVGFFRRADGTGDENHGYLMIHSIDLRY